MSTDKVDPIVRLTQLGWIAARTPDGCYGWTMLEYGITSIHDIQVKQIVVRINFEYSKDVDKPVIAVTYPFTLPDLFHLTPKLVEAFQIISTLGDAYRSGVLK